MRAAASLNALVTDPAVPPRSGQHLRMPPSDTLAMNLTVFHEGAPATSGDSPARRGLEQSVECLISQALQPQLRKARGY